MPSTGLDTSSAVRLRSPSRSPPDAINRAVSSSLTTTVINQRSMRWFDASPRRATPKGHQSFISRTAPQSITPLPQATSHARGTPQFPRVPSLIWISRATSAIDRDDSMTILTASSLNSGVKLLRLLDTPKPPFRKGTYLAPLSGIWEARQWTDLAEIRGGRRWGELSNPTRCSRPGWSGR